MVEKKPLRTVRPFLFGTCCLAEHEELSDYGGEIGKYINFATQPTLLFNTRYLYRLWLSCVSGIRAAGKPETKDKHPVQDFLKGEVEKLILEANRKHEKYASLSQ